MNQQHFENELQRALTRVLPPEGFAERVLHRLPAPAQNRQPRLSAFLALAAMVTLMASMAFYRHYEHKERERVQKAQQQLAFALRLTSEKLTVVEARLKKSAPQLQIRKTKEQL